MSRIESVTCDGCGVSAPEGYERGSWLDPRYADWLYIEYRDVSLDACSWECLARIAAHKGALSQ